MKYAAYRTMTKEDVRYIQEQRKLHRELKAVRKIALHTQERAKAYRCRVQMAAIETELLTKYDLIL